MVRWRGVFPAVTTKFKEDGGLDIVEMERCFALQVQAGVHGLIVAGSLGEGQMLDMVEKAELLRAALRVAGGKIPVLMTISNASTREACLFAEASAKYGANGFMLLPGLPYRSDPQETETHFRTVAAAGGLPVMIYNNPVSYGVDVTPEMFVRLADEPLFQAIKESSDDVRRITRIINLTGDRYDLFSGVDNLALESLLLGAKGWVAGLVAAFPRETTAIWRQAMSGNIEDARRLYRWFHPLLDLDVSTKLVQNIKLVETMVIGSNDRCRPPRLPLQGAERARVVKVVRYALASRAGIAAHTTAAE